MSIPIINKNNLKVGIEITEAVIKDRKLTQKVKDEIKYMWSCLTNASYIFSGEKLGSVELLVEVKNLLDRNSKKNMMKN